MNPSARFVKAGKAIIGLETKAKAHLGCVIEAKRAERELRMRKTESERKQRRIGLGLREIEEKRTELIEEHDRLETKIQEEFNENERLFEMEQETERLELSIEQKEIEVKLAQEMYDADNKEELMIQQEEGEFMCDSDEVPCEFFLDLEERDIDRQIHHEQLRRNQERLYCQRRLERLEALVNSVQSKIDQRDNTEEAIHKHQIENAELELDINAKKRNIEILKEQLLSRSVTTKEITDDSAELERLLSQESQLEKQGMELELEEEILSVEEAQFSTVKANLEEDKAIIHATDASNKALMNLYRAQLKLAQNQSTVDRAITKLSEPYTTAAVHSNQSMR